MCVVSNSSLAARVHTCTVGELELDFDIGLLKNDLMFKIGRFQFSKMTESVHLAASCICSKNFIYNQRFTEIDKMTNCGKPLVRWVGLSDYVGADTRRDHN